MRKENGRRHRLAAVLAYGPFYFLVMASLSR